MYVYNWPSAAERFVRNRMNRRMISFLVYVICERMCVCLCVSEYSYSVVCQVLVAVNWLRVGM